MSKNVFIDIGAHNGNSVNFFKNNWEDYKKFEIHSFECNPIFKNTLNKIDGIWFHNLAAWIYNGVVDFYVGDELSSTLIKEKETGNIDVKNPIQVECIDLSEWIVNNFDINDYIILKIDAEGAEYKILNKMIDDKSIRYINELYGEWHGSPQKNKIDLPEGEHSRLVGRLYECGLDMHDWCAEANRVDKYYE